MLRYKMVIMDTRNIEIICKEIFYSLQETILLIGLSKNISNAQRI